MKLLHLLAPACVLATTTTAFFLPAAPSRSGRLAAPLHAAKSGGGGNWFTSVLPKPAASNAKTSAAAAAQAATLKQELYALAKGKDNGLKATEAEKEQILAVASQLIKLNPEKNIAKSSKVRTP